MRRQRRGDGIEAVSLFQQEAFDLVLLDVMLPKYDGYEVCQAIREFSDMPIIMLTAKGGDMDKILGLEYGADDYISKPSTYWRSRPESKHHTKKREEQTSEAGRAAVRRHWRR